MFQTGPIRVLLIEDDEDDYILASELLSDIRGRNYSLDWLKTFDTGLEAMCRNQHDVALVDYQLGARNGIELLRAATERGCQLPVILLTGAGEHEVDMEAMQAGAADYLVKGQIQPNSLERTIRYALQRKRAAALAAFEQARLAAFGAEIGLALTQREPLDRILDRCAKAMVQYLNASATQLFTFDSAKQVFEPRASAGQLLEKNPCLQILSALRLDPGSLSQGKPILIRQLRRDERLQALKWVMTGSAVSYAAYPLILEDKLVGLMSVLANHPFSEQICQEMGSVANGIALCIEQKRSVEALDTSRKEAEVQIQKLAAFPRVNPDPVLEFAADGTLTYANEAALAMTRSLGKEQVDSILPPNAATLASEALKNAQKKLGQEVQINGRTITWSFFPVSGSHVVHCYGSDVTERLNLEAQFRHAQKLESVGQLAAGIAHDFNNILTVIQGFADFLIKRCNGDTNMSTPLTRISEAARRAAGLTRQLLMFSRKQMIQPKAIDLNSLLLNFATMLPRLLREDIKVETNFAPDLMRIEGDTGMLEQVIMNLAVNARDAMPKGGKLIITTSDTEVSPDYARQNPESRAGKFVCLTVTDTGCGMDRKTMERIFEPFFSTKDVGKGTGLGLATVYGILKQQQGWIEVSTKVDIGTTFKIYFPAVARPAPAAPESPAPEVVRGGNETILLVEDEVVVREFVSEVLRQHDYKVIEAGSGVEALKVWDKHQGKLDLLLTDIIMPEGMNGRELAAELKKRNPNLKVIYTSGYSPEVIGKEFERSETTFLAKPYAAPRLAQVVRRALDSMKNRAVAAGN